jgi:hypothetical protein
MIDPDNSILIIADDDALSAFMPALVGLFRKELAVTVKLKLVSGGGTSGPTPLHTLLALEKLIMRRGRPSWSDRISPADVAELLVAPSDGHFSIVVDLTNEARERSGLVFRPLFDGNSGEEALAAALFFRGTPRISIAVQRNIGVDPATLCAGIASLESAAGIGGAMEAVWSRTAMLLVKAIRSETQRATDREGSVDRGVDTPALTRAKTVRHSVSALAGAAARAAYALCCHRPHWRIGWRKSGVSDDVWARRSLDGPLWNILRDPIDHFYADPFPCFRDGRDYIFFEDLDHKTQKGIISVVEIDDQGRPGPAIPVLEEPWHLSYPFLIEAEGEVWMIPEASLSGQITIYRARQFPWSWERHAVLVPDVEAADATIVKHEDRLWMLAVIRQGIGGYSDTLAIWSSNQLFGNWQAHGQNPVLIDDREARPAGAFVRRNGHLFRPVQDCRKGYGAALGLARVTQLNESGFSQVVETHLEPGLSAWPGRKLHTLNGNGRIEVIDGSVPRPKSALGREFVDNLYRPRR